MDDSGIEEYQHCVDRFISRDHAQDNEVIPYEIRTHHFSQGMCRHPEDRPIYVSF